MDQQSLAAMIVSVMARAPQWIRRDLAAKDPALRQRAEESLAGMIAAALSADLCRDNETMVDGEGAAV